MTTNPDRWSRRIDAVSGEVERVFGPVDAGRLNAQPAPGTWSVAQNLDHLIRLNESYWPVIDRVRRGEQRLSFAARIPFLSRLLGRTLLKAVQPDTRMKTRTFPVWEPTDGEVSGDIVRRFLAHQEELRTLIASSDDLVARRVVIHSPANRHIVYPLDTAFDIIVAHEERHLAQARAALATLLASEERHE